MSASPFLHDVSAALAANPGLRSAYGERLRQADTARKSWASSADPRFLAIRRSVTAEDDLDAARAVAEQLTKNATDVVLLGIGGSSLGAQTLLQLGFWGTPAYVPRVGRPRLHVLDGLDGAVFRGLLQSLDLRTTRFLVVSKSGSTAEPLVQTLAAAEALEAAGGGKYLKHHLRASRKRGPTRFATSSPPSTRLCFPTIPISEEGSRPSVPWACCLP